MRSRAAVAETVAAAPVVAPPSAKVPEPEPAPVPEPTPVADTAPVVEPVEPEPEVRAEAVEPDAPAAAIEPVVEPVVEPTVEPVVEVQAEPDPVEEPKVEIVAASADPAPMAASVAADPVVVQPVETDADEDLTGDPPAAAAAAPAAYAVDESVLAILREEAEREALARKSDVGKPLEVQADLGIESAPAVKKKPVEVISTDADTVAPAEDADDKLAGRRTRLPDVEEINSTLRPSEQLIDTAADEPGDVATEGRSSFRSGFLLVMTLAIVGAALYISADALAEAVPALAGVLKAYVGLVDGLRLQLDGLMQSATVAINGSGP
ncbi:hypothetical protein [Rhodobacter sp. SY28-1]|uniref:hypothetical protein n=1 Tax=Rhodobacter sp. SY28-1 TaxID=2562317 RepID=UPI001F10D7D9|nr:hypothetical protein [Rhodobacter sp. SY28-1]